MDINFIRQTVDLANYEDGAIIVFGNFALVKKTFHLERWQQNQMDRHDIVNYFMRGDQVLIDQKDGWELYKHVVGEDCIYQLSNKFETFYIIA